MKKIIFIGSGIGRIKRGLEAHVEDLFNNMSCISKYEIILFKGAGRSKKKEKRIANFPRNSFAAKMLAFITQRNSFEIQNITFFIGMIPQLIKNEIRIIYLGEPVVCNLLLKWRKLTGQKFKIIFFTGGQTIPAYMGEKDIIHHVSPLCIGKATERGISGNNQLLIPHFLNISEKGRNLSIEEKIKLRDEFKIPEDAFIILSVGAIDCTVKRMDYLIEEVSDLRENIFLIILGEEETETKKVKTLAAKCFLKKNYRIKTLPRKETGKYYSLADVFVLASLAEGFGMAYIEALSYGIPVIAHDYPTARYVLKTEGCFTDLSIKGNLETAISEIIKNKSSIEKIHHRHQFVYENYSWEKLKSDYINMFD